MGVFKGGDLVFNHSTGKTLTIFLVFPFLLNFTTPSAVENNVSSPARLTFKPGCVFVPPWRSMMPPANIDCPSVTFIPVSLH
ncbi:MAG: hypothetical protein CM1200mP10_31490 [Candidatus Neomarinimicrobiota bacterium]|nr:MAG: hypothetical protein CM1200mP10_31490 [Candidatus Neomarinimicrobiota bacterium]